VGEKCACGIAVIARDPTPESQNRAFRGTPVIAGIGKPAVAISNLAASNWQLAIRQKNQDQLLALSFWPLVAGLVFNLLPSFPSAVFAIHKLASTISHIVGCHWKTKTSPLINTDDADPEVVRKK